jgi:hypothetical protein
MAEAGAILPRSDAPKSYVVGAGVMRDLPIDFESYVEREHRMYH